MFPSMFKRIVEKNCCLFTAVPLCLVYTSLIIDSKQQKCNTNLRQNKGQNIELTKGLLMDFSTGTMAERLKAKYNALLFGCRCVVCSSDDPVWSNFTAFTVHVFYLKAIAYVYRPRDSLVSARHTRP